MDTVDNRELSHFWNNVEKTVYRKESFHSQESDFMILPEYVISHQQLLFK